MINSILTRIRMPKRAKKKRKKNVKKKEKRKERRKAQIKKINFNQKIKQLTNHRTLLIVQSSSASPTKLMFQMIMIARAPN